MFSANTRAPTAPGPSGLQDPRKARRRALWKMAQRKAARSHLSKNVTSAVEEEEGELLGRAVRGIIQRRPPVLQEDPRGPRVLLLDCVEQQRRSPRRGREGG